MRYAAAFRLVLFVTLAGSTTVQAAPAAAPAPALRLAPGGSSLASVVRAEDLCAPCSASEQCATRLCPTATDSNGYAFGLCSQACTAQGACPTGFACYQVEGQALCYPAEADACPSPYRGNKNTLCAMPSATDDPNKGVERICAPGLTCYRFPSQVGVCVSECSSINADADCAAGETCCFDTTADGACIRYGSATTSIGGCFTIGDVGSGCAQPDHSYCVNGAVCDFTQVAASAVCYNSCKTTSCGAGGYCVNSPINNQPICCDARTLNLNDIYTCEPQQGLCRRELGVTCARNDDCLLGLCQRYGTQAACSVTCTSDADCPDASADVNGDGIADGGSQCLDMDGLARCWPTAGPLPPPVCATALPAVTGKGGGGCQCSSGADNLLGFGAAVAGAAMRQMRRRRHGRRRQCQGE